MTFAIRANDAGLPGRNSLSFYGHLIQVSAGVKPELNTCRGNSTIFFRPGRRQFGLTRPTCTTHGSQPQGPDYP